MITGLTSECSGDPGNCPTPSTDESSGKKDTERHNQAHSQFDCEEDYESQLYL